MSEVLDQEPPQDPEDWSEEQWREWLLSAPADPETGHAHPMSRFRQGGGAVVAAAMFGLEQAIYGERPKVEIVAEADAPDVVISRSTALPSASNTCAPSRVITTQSPSSR